MAGRNRVKSCTGAVVKWVMAESGAYLGADNGTWMNSDGVTDAAMEMCPQDVSFFLLIKPSTKISLLPLDDAKTVQ